MSGNAALGDDRPSDQLTGGDHPMRRLHPLSPVLRGLRMLVVVVAAISLRGIEQMGLPQWLITVLAVLAGVLIYSVIVWRFTGFEVVGRELRIHDGVLSRRVRAVPLERLQAVEVTQPIIARPFGLAELKLDVAGAEKSEAPLAFLTLGQARDLRNRLLAIAGGTSPADAATAPPADEAAAIHATRNRDIVASQLLTPSVMATPLAILYIVGQVFFNREFGIFAILTMATALFGTIGWPLMRIQSFWNFRLSQTGSGNLHVTHGLLERRSQTVPVHRVQSLTMTWPLLWRSHGWLRVTLAVAGQSSGGSDGRKAETDRLLPVADLETARRIAPLALPGIDLTELPLVPAPARARWLAPLRRPVLAAGLTPEAFGSVDGLLTRQLAVVPYQRIQSVRLTQGPWQRKLNLATVHVDIAGGSPITAPLRDLTEAYAWAQELTDRARIARGE